MLYPHNQPNSPSQVANFEGLLATWNQGRPAMQMMHPGHQMNFLMVKFWVVSDFSGKSPWTWGFHGPMAPASHVTELSAADPSTVMKILQKSHWYFMIHEKIIKSGKVCPYLLAHFGLTSSLVKSVKSLNFEGLLHLSVLQLTSRYGDVSKRRISQKLPCWWGSLKRLDLLLFPVFAQHFFLGQPQSTISLLVQSVTSPNSQFHPEKSPFQAHSARFSILEWWYIMIYPRYIVIYLIIL